MDISHVWISDLRHAADASTDVLLLLYNLSALQKQTSCCY